VGIQVDVSGFWHRVVLRQDTGGFFLPWRWRQQGPPKRWCPTATLHGVTTRKVSSYSTLLYSLKKLYPDISKTFPDLVSETESRCRVIKSSASYLGGSGSKSRRGSRLRWLGFLRLSWIPLGKFRHSALKQDTPTSFPNHHSHIVVPFGNT
jgi:hypothetical protein